MTPISKQVQSAKLKEILYFQNTAFLGYLHIHDLHDLVRRGLGRFLSIIEATSGHRSHPTLISHTELGVTLIDPFTPLVKRSHFNFFFNHSFSILRRPIWLFRSSVCLSKASSFLRLKPKAICALDRNSAFHVLI